MSPSQASETCASASSATSACVRFHYANGSGQCQERSTCRTQCWLPGLRAPTPKLSEYLSAGTVFNAGRFDDGRDHHRRKVRFRLRLTLRKTRSSSKTRRLRLRIRLRSTILPTRFPRGPRPSQRPFLASWQFTNLPHLLCELPKIPPRP